MVENAQKFALPSWRAPLEFACHAIVGASIFVIIACAAVGLDFLVVILKNRDTDVVIVVGLKIAEYAIFGVDLLLFGIFLYRAAKRTITHL